MSISFLVYIILGQYFGAFLVNQWLGRELFAVEGYAPGLNNWAHYCLLPVMIGVIVGMGYDSRYYRAVMVEECRRDYMATALAKGASKWRIMFVHMLKNAMIPIITRVVISLPFLIAGSILLENFFNFASQLAARAQALADPTRLVILRMIRHFAMTNTEIAAYLGISRPTVSVHAKILREAGLIDTYEVGRAVQHKIEPVALRKLFEDLIQFLDLPEE